MSAQSSGDARRKTYLRLLQNPYASLSVEDEAETPQPSEATLEQKHAYLRDLENPYAYFAIFGDPDEEQASRTTPKQGTLPLNTVDAQPHDSADSRAALEKLFDDVLRLYKPYVARNEWKSVADFRTTFLNAANRTPRIRERVADRLQKLKFSLMPGEKVEHNRAPAERIIGELRRLVT